MLKIRENVPPPVPEPLSPQAVEALFKRIRAELGLQGVDAADAAEYARKAGASWPRAADEELRAL